MNKFDTSVNSKTVRYKWNITCFRNRKLPKLKFFFSCLVGVAYVVAMQCHISWNSSHSFTLLYLVAVTHPWRLAGNPVAFSMVTVVVSFMASFAYFSFLILLSDHLQNPQYISCMVNRKLNKLDKKVAVMCGELLHWWGTDFSGLKIEAFISVLSLSELLNSFKSFSLCFYQSQKYDSKKNEIRLYFNLNVF